MMFLTSCLNEATIELGGGNYFVFGPNLNIGKQY